MSLHWSEKRTAIAATGKALAALGWRLWGWHDDRSDSLSDYFDPESWDGVATLDLDGERLVVCVDVGDYRAKFSSGQVPVTHQHRDAGACERCKGTGIDPEVPYTLTTARENPQAFNDAWTAVNVPGSIDLMRAVVSPVKFNPDGSVKCRDCKGSGKRFEVVEIPGEPWPTFHATPRGSTWHVEKGGAIVARGTGLSKAHPSYGGEAAQLAARIHAAATGAGAFERGEGVTVKENPSRNGVEIRFADRPPEAVRLRLKAAGWRFSRRQSLWYNRATPEARAFAAELVRGILP